MQQFDRNKPKGFLACFSTTYPQTFPKIHKQGGKTLETKSIVRSFRYFAVDFGR